MVSHSFFYTDVGTTLLDYICTLIQMFISHLCHKMLCHLWSIFISQQGLQQVFSDHSSANGKALDGLGRPKLIKVKACHTRPASH